LLGGTVTFLLAPFIFCNILYRISRCCRKSSNSTTNTPSASPFRPAQYLLPSELAASLPTQRFAAAFVNICLFSYSSVSRATFALLHCVSIEGLSGADANSTFLFGDATAPRCYDSWQVPFFIFMVVLVLLPLLLAIWIYRYQSSFTMPSPFHPLRLTAFQVRFRFTVGFVFVVSFFSPLPPSLVLQILCEPFTSDRLTWNMVILLQRFLLIVAGTFITSTFSRQLSLCFLLLFFLLLYPILSPFRLRSAHYLNLFCCCLLVLYSVLNIHNSVLVTIGFFPKDQLLSNWVNVFYSVTLPLPLFFAAIIMLSRKRWCIRLCKANSEASQSGEFAHSQGFTRNLVNPISVNFSSVSDVDETAVSSDSFFPVPENRFDPLRGHG
jgi:hypothetical protein